MHSRPTHRRLMHYGLGAPKILMANVKYLTLTADAPNILAPIAKALPVFIVTNGLWTQCVALIPLEYLYTIERVAAPFELRWHFNYSSIVNLGCNYLLFVFLILIIILNFVWIVYTAGGPLSIELGAMAPPIFRENQWIFKIYNTFLIILTLWAPPHFKPVADPLVYSR